MVASAVQKVTRTRLDQSGFHWMEADADVFLSALEREVNAATR
jgi:hypothetical protein